MDTFAHSSSFENLFGNHKTMMRITFIQFLLPYDIVKISLLSRQMNMLVDPNRRLITTDENL